MSARDILAALSVAIVWGLTFISIKGGVGDASPLTLAGLRFLFAATPIVAFVTPPKASPWAVVPYGLPIGGDRRPICAAGAGRRDDRGRISVRRNSDAH